MTKNEMLLKLLAQSGWVVTDDTDENGSTIVVANENDEQNN